MSFDSNANQEPHPKEARAELALFSRALALKESGGLYHLKNAKGYAGRYQLGQDRLDDFNRVHRKQHTIDELIKSPELQEEIQIWHIQDIDKYIDDTGLCNFIGQNFNGVTLSRNSLRAVAHLGGKRGLRNFVLSNGVYDPSDFNGTRLSHYAIDFANSHSDPKANVLGNSQKKEEPSPPKAYSAPLHDQSGAFGVIHPKEAQDWASRDNTLGRHLPIGETNGLRFRMDGRTSAESLAEIIDWLDVTNSLRYAPDGHDTFCNVYACDFCYLAGAYLPRIWWFSNSLKAGSRSGQKPSDPIEMTANALFDWLDEHGSRFGWRRVPDLTELQTAANDGKCSLIVGKSHEDRHGHIALVCPETDADKAIRSDGKVQIPLQSQTSMNEDQAITDPLWWRQSQFIDFGFWVHDRRTGRSEKLKPRWWILAISQYFCPDECALLDAKLSIYRDEVLRSTRLPEEFILALVAGEDKRFFRHPGFDFIAILRAIARFCLQRKIEGASTIEQQLVRTITGRKERTLRRKLGEILLAMRYSSALDKKTIASIYLENAYFGWRASGCRNALKRDVFVRETEIETAAWLVASLRYPVASVESDNRLRIRHDRAKFIINRIEKNYRSAKWLRIQKSAGHPRR